ncbi:sensor histidine kinase [Chloroflexus sp.]|uniref:sensor histidine kinase n=1 Tax=Chloroflexus sp. TaxID=1904827 RepID=UPI00260BBE24|nr:ATP-binding protein [uncultured Chloroflexus sp.]
MVHVAHHPASEGFSISAAILDAQQLVDLERMALTALRRALPHHQATLIWSGHGQPESDLSGLVRPLATTKPLGWLVIRPAEMTEAEANALGAIEHLIVIGYERLQARARQASWDQRLHIELEVLSGNSDPDVICRQIGQMLSRIIGCPVEMGVVAPVSSSLWLELVARYSEQMPANATGTQFWLADVDLSSAVIKLGVPISTAAYLTDCARYNVRPHPDYQSPETTPAYWVGAPIRLTGESIGMTYAFTTQPISEEQQRILAETVYRVSQALLPGILRREFIQHQERSKAWQEIVAASLHLVDPDRALQTMLEASCRLLAVYGGGIFLWDEERHEAIFRYASNAQLSRLVGFRLSSPQSILMQSLIADKPVIMNDATDDPRRSHILDRIVGITATNLISVPHTTPAGIRFLVQFINRHRNAPFTERDIEQIRAIVGLMGLVFDQARRQEPVATEFVQQARERDWYSADLRSVLAFNREMLSASDHKQLFQLIIDTIGQRAQFQSAALFVNQHNHRLHPVLTCVAVMGDLGREFWLGRTLAASRLDVLANEWSFGEDCFLLNRHSPTFAVLFDIPPSSSSTQYVTFGTTQWEATDLLVVLLRAANREVQAILLLDHPVNGRRPTVAELEVLTVYASIAGSAIDMALLRDRQQRSLERLTALNGLGMVIHSQSLPQPQVLEMTARGMLEMVNAAWAQIVLYDRDHDELVLDQMFGISALEPDIVTTLARRALLNRRPVFRSATTVAVPLRGTQRMIGVIVLGSEQAFDSTDIEMLMLYATQAAVAVESMRLLEEVRRGRDNLARVMAAVQDGLILFAADGVIIVANEAFYRLAQTSAWSSPLSQIEGRTINDVLIQWMTQRMLDPRDVAALQRLLTVSNATGVLSSKDTILAWQVTQAGDLTAGRSQAFLLTIRDVTAARKAEQLRDDLTHMLIHDLRNPLNTILLAFERLTNELGDLFTERQQQAVRVGQNSAHRLLNLVNTMLEIGRLESGQMPLDRGPLPIEAVIERVIDPFSIQAQLKQVKIVYRIDPHIQMVFADSNIIARVLQNLLENALKFSPSAGVITLEVANVPANGQDQIVQISDELTLLIPGNRMAHFVVRDQGVGIPPEDQERIFDRFSQVSRRRNEGIGLGLTFCRLAVEAHHGAIWVESQPDQGSAFHFTLPLAEIVVE